MRNLKRALSLGLASAMALGTMAFTASAKDITANTTSKEGISTSTNFLDDAQITNKEAVYLANAVGLMVGDQGYFNPETVVTRAHMAAICVTMLYGPYGNNYELDQYLGTVSTQQFTDVGTGHWAFDYINVAASLGIIAGVGNDQFSPSRGVTTAEAMMMILKTLGYYADPSEYGSASNWQLSVTARGTELGLYSTYNLSSLASDSPLTRNDVAAFAFAAITDVVPVDYNAAMGKYYNRYEGDTDITIQNDKVISTLGYQKFDLYQQNDRDDFDRPTTRWVHDAVEIASYLKDDTLKGEFYAEVRENEITALVSGVTNNDNEYTYEVIVDGKTYVDETDGSVFDAASFSKVIDSQKSTYFAPTGDGVLTQVFVVPPKKSDNSGLDIGKGRVVVSIINTHLAEVTRVSDNGNGTDTVTVSYFDGERYDGLAYEKDLEINFESAVSYEMGDVVIINAAEPKFSTGADKKIISVGIPDEQTGTVTEVKKFETSYGGSYVEIDEQVYPYAFAMRGDLDHSSTTGDPVYDSNITAYLDIYGNVLGFIAEEVITEYLYVEQMGDFNLSDGLQARVTLADGSEEVINIVKIDNKTVYDGQIADYNRVEDQANKQTFSANENFQVNAPITANNDLDGDYADNRTLIDNRVYGYTVDSNGDYHLDTDIQATFKNGEGTWVVDESNIGNWDYSLLKEGSMVIGSSVMYKTNVKEDIKGDDSFFLVNTAYDETSNDTFTYGIANGYPGIGYYTSDDYASTGADNNYVAHGTSNWDSMQLLVPCDNNTVFVDVVGDNAPWVGYSNVESMTDKDLNFQAVIGKGGFADVVFINHGAPELSTGNYFVVNEHVEPVVNSDGYNYSVYMNGELTTITSKTAINIQVRINDADGDADSNWEDKDGYEVTSSTSGQPIDADYILEANHLYFISEQDSDGIVYEVKEMYDYSALVNVFASSDITSNGNDDKDASDYHEWSAVKGFGADAFTLVSSAKDSYNKNGEFKTGLTADVFGYNSSTVFVELAADKNGKFNVANISNNPATSIRTTEVTDSSWIDVVSAAYTGAGEHPIAKLVIVVNPEDKANVTTAGAASIWADWTGKSLSTSVSNPTPITAWYYSDSEPTAETMKAGVKNYLTEYFASSGGEFVIELGDDNATIFGIEISTGYTFYFSYDYNNRQREVGKTSLDDLLGDGDVIAGVVTNPLVYLSGETTASSSVAGPNVLANTLTGVDGIEKVTFESTIEEILKDAPEALSGDIATAVETVAANASTDFYVELTINDDKTYVTWDEFLTLTLNDFVSETAPGVTVQPDSALVATLSDDGEASETPALTAMKLSLVRIEVDLAKIPAKGEEFGAYTVTGDTTVSVAYNSSSPVAAKDGYVYAAYATGEDFTISVSSTETSFPEDWTLTFVGAKTETSGDLNVLNSGTLTATYSAGSKVSFTVTEK